MPDLLEDAYCQDLEEAVVARLASVKHLDLAKALDVYYHSKLARQISDGTLGIQYLSPITLVDDLLANESELFCS